MTTTTTKRRYPFDELERVAIARQRVTSVAEIRRATGVSKKVIQRMRRVGMRDHEADEFAIALNLMPMEVWGEAWWLPVCEMIDESDGWLVAQPAQQTMDLGIV